MNYEETLTYLYNSAPLFQQVGKDAYKEGLDNTLALDAHFGHPHRKFKTIHVAGTNGKGSTCAYMNSVLTEAGYMVNNIDVTVVAQRPKLAGYIPQMEVNLAKAVQVEEDAVNVKATTTEKLGFTGRGEGIAATAVAALVK